MHAALRPFVTTGVAVVGASLVAVTPVTRMAPQLADPQVRTVKLTAEGEVVTAAVVPGDLDSSNLALIMGPSTIPIPTDGYLDLVDQLYLAPLGFGGKLEPLATPEGLYPVTGPKSLPFDTSTDQGEKILENAIQQGIADKTISPEHPVTVFGWSQSSTVSALEMTKLHEAGIPSDDVHFVLVGDPNNPDGGMLERFADLGGGGSHDFTVPSLGITFSGTTPADLFPTEIFTNEYDGFADFPRYPIDILSDFNAYLGILFQHIAYLGMSPEQIAAVSADNPAGAIPLPGSNDLGADTLTNYWMMPDVTTNPLTGLSEPGLPLLQVLQFLPFIGQPLYDLLQPDMSILVNLGYGSIDNGWSPGPANVATPFGLLPSASADPGFNWSDVLPALGKGLETGAHDFFNDILNPKNWSLSDYVTGLRDDRFLNGLIELTHALGLTSATDVKDLNLQNLLELGVNGLYDNTGFPTSDVSIFHSSFADVLNSISGTISGDYATLLPIADTFNALVTAVPTLLVDEISTGLTDGNLLGGIGDALAAGTALIPFALIFGAAVPSVVGVGGTLVNLAELVGLGGDASGAGATAATDTTGGILGELTGMLGI